MSVKFCKDTSKELRKLANRLIEEEEDYIPLKHLKVLFIWRQGSPKKDDDNDIVAAETKVLSNRLRDLFGYDCSIEVSEDIWLKLSDAWKKRVLWHELRHLSIELESEDGKPTPVKDKQGRISVKIAPHDVRIRTFKSEILKFGIDTDETDMLQFISRIYSKAKKGKIKKYLKPSALLEVKEEDADREPKPTKKNKKHRVSAQEVW